VGIRDRTHARGFSGTSPFRIVLFLVYDVEVEACSSLGCRFRRPHRQPGVAQRTSCLQQDRIGELNLAVRIPSISIGIVHRALFGVPTRDGEAIRSRVTSYLRSHPVARAVAAAHARGTLASPFSV